jgi:hypothetical protein
MLFSKALSLVGFKPSDPEPKPATPPPMPNGAGSVAGPVAGIAVGSETVSDPNKVRPPKVVPQVVRVFVPEDEPEVVRKAIRRKGKAPMSKGRQGGDLALLSAPSRASRTQTVSLDHARRLVVGLNKEGHHDVDVLASEVKELYRELCAVDNLEPVKDQTLLTALLRINGRRKAHRRLTRDRREWSYFIPVLWSDADRLYLAERTAVGSEWVMTLKLEAREKRDVTLT